MEQEEISICELERLLDLKKKTFSIIDIREEEEYISGHICGAVNIPLCKILKTSFTYDKNQYLIIYCTHGINSLFVCRMLKEKGICAVNLKDGIENYCGKYFVKV